MFRAPTIVCALVFAAACGEKKDALKTDSTLGRDLAMAGQDTAAKPQLTDVAKSAPKTEARKSATKPAAKVAEKAAPPKPAGPTSGMVAAGATLALSTVGQICTSTNKVGDTFTATVTQPVSGTNGVSIPAGATVTFTVSKLKRSENVNDPIEMVFSPASVEVGGKTFPIDATITPGFHVDKVKANPTGSTAKKVAGGAAVGAIAGQLLGKNT
ncbi:MAG TPA: hypothetical protein VF483_02025, partial [Gemmatimonadaceae bacterium]